MKMIIRSRILLLDLVTNWHDELPRPLAIRSDRWLLSFGCLGSALGDPHYIDAAFR